MAMTNEELTLRQGFVGASDVPALFGLDKFKTIVDIWESKVLPLKEQKETPALRYGNLLEPVILTLACDYLKGNWTLLQEKVRKQKGTMAANFDGVLPGGTWEKRGKTQAMPRLIEAKSTGFVGKPMETWGRAGTEDIPSRVLLQAQHQLHVAQTFQSKCGEAATPEICYVALFSGHDARGLSMYPIKYNPEMGERIEYVCNQFWSKYVVPKIQPPIFEDWN